MLPKKYKRRFTPLYVYLHKRAYQKAERYLLVLIEDVFKYASRSALSHTDEVQTILMIYTQFNTLYCNWLRKKRISQSSDIVSLDSSEHSNFLIAHCSDPASMDDLLWELNNYLEDPTERRKEEVAYQLACYKKMCFHDNAL